MQRRDGSPQLTQAWYSSQSNQHHTCEVGVSIRAILRLLSELAPTTETIDHNLWEHLRQLLTRRGAEQDGDLIDEFGADAYSDDAWYEYVGAWQEAMEAASADRQFYRQLGEEMKQALTKSDRRMVVERFRDVLRI